jgi:biotin synthase-like enzyme
MKRVRTERADTFLGDLEAIPLADLLARARELREEGHGRIIGYSRKVFIPLTRLCRDVCGYCTFATSPSRTRSPFLSREEVIEIAQAGRRAGCHEALFTLGDKPELRYGVARSRSLVIRQPSNTLRRLQLWYCVTPGCCRTSMLASCRLTRSRSFAKSAYRRAFCWRVSRPAFADQLVRLVSFWAFLVGCCSHPSGLDRLVLLLRVALLGH